MVIEILGEVAARYARAGYFTVIDGIVAPGWFFEPLSRGRAEARPSSRLAEANVIGQLWEGFDALDERLERYVLDNSELTPDATANLIRERLETGALALHE